MAPSSRFALSLKPSVAYRDLNLAALWKKQTTSPSLAYAGIPYHVLGARSGAVFLLPRDRRFSCARSFIAAFSSAVNASDALRVRFFSAIAVHLRDVHGGHARGPP